VAVVEVVVETKPEEEPEGRELEEMGEVRLRRLPLLQVPIQEAAAAGEDLTEEVPDQVNPAATAHQAS
jgi:hypothetical protein